MDNCDMKFNLIASLRKQMLRGVQNAEVLTRRDNSPLYWLQTSLWSASAREDGQDGDLAKLPLPA